MQPLTPALHAAIERDLTRLAEQEHPVRHYNVFALGFGLTAVVYSLRNFNRAQPGGEPYRVSIYRMTPPALGTGPIAALEQIAELEPRHDFPTGGNPE